VAKPRKLDSGRWNIQVRLTGIPVESRTFDSYTEAVEWRDQRTAELRKVRRQHSRVRGAPVHRTVADLVDYFLAVELPRYSNQGTAKNYRATLLWWREQLGTLPVQDLTTADIATARDRLAQEVSPATVNRYLAPLSVALNLAAGEWMWIPSNPMAGLRRLREEKRRVIVDGQKREPYLDAVERQRLLEAVEASASLNLADLVVLALSSGARQGELLGLTWRDVHVDPSEGIATLSFIDTKNGESRSVDVVGPGFELLMRRRKVRRLDNMHLFPGRRKGEAARFPRNSWDAAREEAGFPNLRFHDLRHYADTRIMPARLTGRRVVPLLRGQGSA